MKQLLSLFIGIFCVLMALGQTNKKIGYANLSELRAELPYFDSAQRELEVFRQPYEQELLHTSNLLRDIAAQIAKAEDINDKKDLLQEHQEVTAIYTDQKREADEQIQDFKRTLFFKIDKAMQKALARLESVHGYDQIYDSAKSDLPAMIGATDVTAILREYLGLKP